MRFPMLTGEVKRLLACSESRLHGLVRAGVVSPPVVDGRRLWSREDVLAAARRLGLDGPAIRNLCRTTPAAVTAGEAGHTTGGPRT